MNTNPIGRKLFEAYTGPLLSDSESEEEEPPKPPPAISFVPGGKK